VKADQKCIKPGNAPWLPQLHEAYAIHHYWNLKCSQFLTGHNYLQAFTKLKHKIPALKLRPPHLHSISANLRATQTTLPTIYKEAQEKRLAHLNELATAAAVCKDKKKK